MNRKKKKRNKAEEVLEVVETVEEKEEEPKDTRTAAEKAYAVVQAKRVSCARVTRVVARGKLRYA